MRDKKLRSFSGAKISCIYDHVKLTVGEFNLNHVLYVGINGLSSKTVMSRSVINIALLISQKRTA